MRSLTIIAILLTIFCQGNDIRAQEDDLYELLGTLELTDGSLITYKLTFSINQDNKISGKSVTDFLGDQKTSTFIEGSISEDGQQITFRETQNISTISSYADTSFCYIHLKKGQLKLRGEKTIIQGHFNSHFPDGSDCIDGDIYLIGQDVILNKLKRTRKFLGKENRQMVDDIISGSEGDKERFLLTDGSNVSVTSKDSIMHLVIWDDQYFDRDQLSVEVNGQIMAKDLVVTKEPKTLTITLTEGSNLVRIISTSEGEAPPNTAVIKMLVDDQELIYKANLGISEIASLSVEH